MFQMSEILLFDIGNGMSSRRCVPPPFMVFLIVLPQEFFEKYTKKKCSCNFRHNIFHFQFTHLRYFIYTKSCQWFAMLSCDGNRLTHRNKICLFQYLAFVVWKLLHRFQALLKAFQSSIVNLLLYVLCFQIDQLTVYIKLYISLTDSQSAIFNCSNYVYINAYSQFHQFSIICDKVSQKFHSILILIHLIINNIW